MGFGEPVFLYGFLPAVLLVYLLTPAAARNLLLLACSLLFYAWGEPVFVLVALASALADLLVVRCMLARPAPGWRHAWVSLGVALNLALLAWYKYAGFLWRQMQGLADGWVALPDFLAPVLPIAVSFIVFEKITYVVDVYRGRTAPARPGNYLLYVFLFPKLLAGPILQYHDLAPQFRRRPLRAEDLGAGLLRFCVGLAKKLLIADSLAVIVDEAFARDPAALEGWYAWLALLCFFVQLYFDFSGYSDMAIGLARCFGFRLRENFRRPYLAESLREFWQRWHISLTRFIRDYLYAALRHDRAAWRVYVNLWICFLATGLWHGANWTFIVWGACHGAVLTLERLGVERRMRRLPRALRILAVNLLLLLSLSLFRAPDIAAAWDYLHALAGSGGGRIDYLSLPRDSLAALAVGLAIIYLPGLPAVERFCARYPFSRPRAWQYAGALLLLALSVGKATTAAFHPFIYFRF